MNTTSHRTHWMLPLAVGIALVFLGAGLSNADGFLDDFEDGDVTNGTPLSDDGTPIIWTPKPNLPGDYDASSGDYVLAPNSESELWMSSQVEDVNFWGTSVRSQVSILEIPGQLGLTVRNQDAGDSHNYTALLEMNNRNGSILELFRTNLGSDFITLGSVFLPLLSISTDDAMLQLDAFGDELKVWAWKAGDPMPAEPQISATDSTYESGFVGILSQRRATGSYRFVEASDMHIPEPSSMVLATLGLIGFGFRRKSS